MRNPDLEAKFRGLGGDVLGQAATEDFLRLCLAIESLPDTTEIARQGGLS